MRAQERGWGESKYPCLAFVCVWLRLMVLFSRVTVRQRLCLSIFVFCRCYICCYTNWANQIIRVRLLLPWPVFLAD
jgi:hypothetical protein